MPVITPQQSYGPDSPNSPLDPALAGQPPVPESSTPPPATIISTSPVQDGSDRPAVSEERPARRRRRWWIPVTAVAAVAAIGGIAVVATSSGESNSTDETATEAAPISAVQAETIDLAEFEEVDGTLSYGDPQAVTAAVAGTVTDVASEGDTIDRGDTLYEVDTRAVTVLWGDTPLYRQLRNGVDDGRDVRVLEENLAALGFTDDGEMVVDDEFDSNTRDAVIAWQYTNAIDGEGVVEASDVVVIDGPAVADTIDATIGSTVNTGSPVLSITVTDATTTALSTATGTVTLTPTVGQTFATGDIAYEIDTVPVAVVIGDVAFERELILGVDDGADVQQLEETLVALGFDADGELVVDEEFDESTATAVGAWQEELGLAADYGSIQVGELLVLPAGSSVLSVDVERSDDISAGDPIMTTGVSNRQITGSIATSDVDLISVDDPAKNAVEVEFADGTTVAGTITAIDATSTVAADGTDTTGFDVTVAEIPESAASSYTADVTIRITSQLVTGATVVPASALVAVGDGTYAVEVVNGNTTSFVAVTPGLFADGNVQVDGIDPGTAVVVPE